MSALLKGILIMKIVLLIGASSVGKSSICAELKDKHQWNVLSFDEVARRVRKPEYLELFKELSLLMTDSEIFQLCHKNSLTISSEKHCVETYEFADPSLPDLENLLKRAGFDEHQIVSLSGKMRTLVVSYVSYHQIMEELFKQTFQQFDDDTAVVLDVIPDRYGNANAVLEQFEKFCQKYRESHPDLSTFTALVYCLPVTLSERINKRNHEAIIQDKPHEIRKGLFPFQQLASLITISNQDSKQPDLGSFSKEELRGIFVAHSLINPKTTDISITSSHSTHLPSEQGVGLQKIKSSDYQNLKKKFGFFKHQKQGILSIPQALHFDITINTETGCPAVLTETLLSQTTSSQPRSGLG